jgi:hypothetical protein
MSNETIRTEFELVDLGIERILYACPVCAATVEDYRSAMIKHKEWHEKLGDWHA